jgi:hypothetical protein
MCISLKMMVDGKINYGIILRQAVMKTIGGGAAQAVGRFRTVQGGGAAPV